MNVEVTLLLLKVLLLFSSLYVYNNQLRNPTEEDIVADEAIANTTGVYITNRYYQKVVTTTDGIRIIERIGMVGGDNKLVISNNAHLDGTNFQ